MIFFATLLILPSQTLMRKSSPATCFSTMTGWLAYLIAFSKAIFSLRSFLMLAVTPLPIPPTGGLITTPPITHSLWCCPRTTAHCCRIHCQALTQSSKITCYVQELPTSTCCRETEEQTNEILAAEAAAAGKHVMRAENYKKAHVSMRNVDGVLTRKKLTSCISNLSHTDNGQRHRHVHT